MVFEEGTASLSGFKALQVRFLSFEAGFQDLCPLCGHGIPPSVWKGFAIGRFATGWAVCIDATPTSNR